MAGSTLEAKLWACDVFLWKVKAALAADSENVYVSSQLVKHCACCPSMHEHLVSRAKQPKNNDVSATMNVKLLYAPTLLH